MSTGEVVDESFETLLEFLKVTRGFDFTGYKRSSLQRRVSKRLNEVGIKNYAEYLDYLQVRPEEFAQLFNTILINVTGFFRDAPAWDYLAKTIIPRLVNGKRKGEPVRVWSAGCASGEEAYSVAILLAEALGEESFHDRVKIYATDVDEEALAQARQGNYSAGEVSAIAAERREKYFDSLMTRYVFRNDLRRSVIFGRHDLVQDAPISRLDLLLCRNVLMYFNADAQARILSHLHFALANPGYLFLGRAEMLLTHTHLFAPIDLKNRVFEKVSRPRERELVRESAAHTAANPGVAVGDIRDLAFDSGLLAQIVVGKQGTLSSANRLAQAMFGLTESDIGRTLQDLQLSYRPTNLRSLIDQAYADRSAVTRESVEYFANDGATQYLDVAVHPLLTGDGSMVGVSVVFDDVTRFRRLQEDLKRSKEELETAYEELQSTNEELETTNEELQSTVEELETTNEELQSTNEELETMNEELQSTNTELQAINDELNDRTGALDRANSFLASILASQKSAVVVVDRNFAVAEWNARAEDLWGVTDREVKGQSLLKLDIGLPVSRLAETLRACLVDDASPAPVTLPATNRRGKSIQCRVVCTPLASPEGERQGVVVVMETLDAS